MTRFVIATSSLLKRSLWLIGLVAIVATVVALATTAVLGRGDGQSFPGTTAPGSHEWWDAGNADAEFCDQCHSAVATELGNTSTAGTHPVTACLACHGTQGTGAHAATPAKCVDCHANRAAELVSADEAHSGLLADLGETETDASWTCKACHTKVEINITTTPMGPLQLTQD
jgi:hypothetical protein